MPTPKYDDKRDQWCIRARVIVDGREIFKRFSGDTKKACNQAYIDYMSEYTPNYQSLNTERITVRQLVEDYISSNKQNWKTASLYDTVSRSKHIIEFLGDIDARKLSPADINAWQNSLSKYSYKYKKLLRETLAAALHYGNRIYDLPYVLDKVPPFRDLSTHEISYWEPSEFQQFYAYCDDEYKLFFRFLYVSGCRKGEAMALKKSNLLSNGVKINASITSKGGSEGWQLTTPKNRSSVRDVSMPDEIMDELRKCNGDFIFGGDRPFPFRNIDRAFAKGIKLSGVKPIRIHDLRHSCASLLISRGASIVAVSKRLGHSDTKMTLNTYAHLMPQEEDKVIAAFNGI